ncbi:MAG: hypothetical protein RR585_00995 [Coprobacillus sp.]
MKKLLCAMLCIGMLVGCGGSNTSSKDNEISKKEEIKETALDKVSKYFTLTKDVTEQKSNIVRVKDNDGNMFIYYVDLQGNDKSMGQMIGLKEKSIAFSTNNEKDSFCVDSDKTIITFDETLETLKDKMNKLLKTANVTIDEVKEACAKKAE